MLYKKNKQLSGEESRMLEIITDHDYLNVLDISTSVILLKDGATKRIKDVNELTELGYIPSRG